MTDKEIHRICKGYEIEGYTIESGLINVDGDVNFEFCNLTKLPLKFGKVSGNFWCGGNELIKLEGAPREVGGGFDCSFNNLVSLNGAPVKVGGHFGCTANNRELSYERYLLKIERLNKLSKI